MRVLFIGCVESSMILLQELIKIDVDIVGVITKEQSLFNSDFKDLSHVCIKNKIDYRYVTHINTEESINYIKMKKPDVIYCFGWSELISSEIINIPPRGIVGFHPAALPQNRGRHPIIWALVLGLKETASTFFMIEETADSGAIISQEKILIEYEDDASSLYNKIMETAKRQVKVFTTLLQKGDDIGVTQSNVSVNYWRKRSKKDGQIDWRMSSLSIYNLVRGLTPPYVGAHFNHNEKEIKVWKVKEIRDLNLQNIEYGKVLKVFSDTSFLVKVGDHAIHVLESEYVKLKEGEYLQ